MPPFGCTVARAASSEDSVGCAGSRCPGRIAPTSSRGIRLVIPSVDLPSCVHSRSSFRTPFGLEQPARSLVPSSWFCTTSTACSARSLQACCILLPTLGFVAFRRSCLLTLPPGRREPLPATRITPLEGSPSSAAARCLHRRCSPCRCPRRPPNLLFRGVVGLMDACASTVASLSPKQQAARSPSLGHRLRFQSLRFARGLAGSRLRGLAPLMSP
jgi:hypothetical protein